MFDPWEFGRKYGTNHRTTVTAHGYKVALKGLPADHTTQSLVRLAAEQADGGRSSKALALLLRARAAAEQADGERETAPQTSRGALVDFAAFVQLLRERLEAGLVMQNPGGGTSTVVSCSDARLCYRRRASKFWIYLRPLYDAYQHFAGGDVSTNDLAAFAPGVFDQDYSGHNCHRTFFLMALLQMGVVGAIWGSGRSGDPFGVTIPPL
jgi:hypothetical protein